MAIMQIKGKGMALSRDKIEKMKEDELREIVLVPMFRAMGFEDVRLFHGQNERGKDLIMWKAGIDSAKEYYVVVAKAKKISGKASGPGSAQELFFQIDQALQNTYPDPSTNTTIKASRCIVANSHSVTPQAHNAIEGSMRDRGYDKLTEFIDGDELWRHVKKYCLRETLLAKKQELNEALSAYDDDVITKISQRGDQIDVAFLPRKGTAPIPFKVKAQIQVPEGKAGDDFLHRARRHVEAGEAIEIPAKYITKLESSSFMAPFMDLDELAAIYIRPALNTTRPIHLSFSAFSESKEVFRIDHVPFAGHGGTTEVVLKSVQENVSYRIAISGTLGKNPLSFNFEMETRNCWGIEALHTARFALALSKGALLTVTWDESESEFCRAEIPPGFFPSYSLEAIQILEKLQYIQSKLHTAFFLPADGLTDSSRELIETVHEILNTGCLEYEDKVAKANLVKADMDRWLAIAREKIVFPVVFPKPDAKGKLLGTLINLGPVCLSNERTIFEDPEEIERQVEENAEAIWATMKGFEESPFKIYYKNWIPAEILKSLPPDFWSEYAEEDDALQS